MAVDQRYRDIVQHVVSLPEVDALMIVAAQGLPELSTGLIGRGRATSFNLVRHARHGIVTAVACGVRGSEGH